MAVLFMVKTRIKLALWFVGVGIALGALATWDAAGQAGSFGDEERFLLRATVTGALVLTWVVLLVVYASARYFIHPKVSRQHRRSHIPWQMLKYAIPLVFIVIMSVVIYGLSARVSTEFSLLEKGDLLALREHIAKDPAALVRTDQETGKTLLVLALESNKPEAVGLLLESGAELECTTNEHNWVIAALPSLLMLETLLVHGVDPDTPDADGLAPIHHTIQTQNTSALALLLKYGADTSVRNPLYQTPLTLAIMKDQLPLVGFLLEHGADPNLWDRLGDTALHKAVRRRNLETTNLLIQNGADSKYINFSGMAPLHIAALNGQNELIELLLAQPGTVGLRNPDDRTAFDYALRGRKYETARLLLQHGAELDRIHENGYTAIHLLLIAKEYRSVRFLIAEGANVQIADLDGETAYDLMRRKQLHGLLDLVEERDHPSPSSANTVDSIN